MLAHASPRACATLLLLAVLAGCNSKTELSPPAATPKTVNVIIAAPTEIAVSNQLPGRLEAYRQAEVRARVAGIVTNRLYREGQEVRKGSPLFQIDPAPLQTALEMAAAALDKAEANAASTTDKVQRYQALTAVHAVSQLAYAEALAAERQAKAEVASAKAAQRRARLELNYATVKAPIDGRARRALVTEGALVGQDTATPLTTIEQIDPIYVNFSQSAALVARMRNAIRAGDLQGVPKQDIAVQLILGDGSIYPLPGKLIFSDLAIDPATDTIAMRAVVPNPDHILLPGGYVQVRLAQAVNTSAILIPRHALLRTANTATVMVVNADNVIEAVTVQADGLHGDNWLVTAGLNGGEKVIVANLAKMKPGITVTPLEQTASAEPTTATTNATAATAGSVPAQRQGV